MNEKERLERLARCVCRHFYSVHKKGLVCEAPSGRGVCSCREYRAHPDQIHVETFALLRSHITRHGYAPSVRELAAELGLSSTATTNARLDVLESAGLISRVGPRAIRLNGADDE